MSSPEIITKSPRYPELDSLRGIAVLIVLLHHYIYAYNYHFHILEDNQNYSIFGFLQSIFSYGTLGVHLFFIISGFVIFMTLERSKNSLDFIVSRFSRLYPAYWGAMLLTLVFLYLLPVPTLRGFSTKDILMNLTMLQGLTKIPHIDQVYWTLLVEILFYTIMYVIFLTKNLNKIIPICAVWLLISLVSLYLPIPFKKYLDVLLILQYAPLFIAGILFYKLKKEGRISIGNHLLIISTMVVESIWLIKSREADITSITILSVIYIVFYIFSLKNITFLRSRILLFFGSISYSLYLLHNVIGYCIIYKLKESTDIAFVYISIPIIISITLSVLLNTFIEKPSMKYIREKYKLYKLSRPGVQL